MLAVAKIKRGLLTSTCTWGGTRTGASLAGSDIGLGWSCWLAITCVSGWIRVSYRLYPDTPTYDVEEEENSNTLQQILVQLSKYKINGK